MPSVSFVIPTYNGQHLLKKYLPSVIKAAQSGDELIIIDDASQDSTLSWLKSEFGLRRTTLGSAYSIYEAALSTKHLKLKVIINARNLRFGASCNRAVELATHPYIFLLNNDVEPERSVLNYVLPHFSDSTVFAVGCHEIEEHEGGVSGGKNILRYEKGMIFHQRASNFSSGDTAWASGGSAVFDRNKWLELGGFDPAYYPAYWEDTDLSYRARLAGWKVLFEAKAIVHHNHETTNSSVFGQKKIDAMSWRNAQVFMRKNGTLSQKVAHWFWLPYWWWKWLRFSQR